MAGAAADHSSEYHAPTLGFATLTTEMDDGAKVGNRGTSSSEEDLGEPQREPSAMDMMKQMMKQQMDMFKELLKSSTEKGTKKTP